jgi:transcriptional regulator with XRE-family HTH domain
MTSARPATTRGTRGQRSKQLQLVRTATGWKQSQLLVRLEAAAGQLDVEVAPRASLKTMVSKWENGAPMSADYRSLFRHVYGMTDEQLGFEPRSASPTGPAPTADDEIEAWQLADAMTRTSVTLPALAVMERAVLGYATRYPATPPRELLPLVRQQMHRLRHAIDGPQPLAVRRHSVTLLGVLAGIAGNLSIDVGRPDQAAAMFDAGRLAAAEADDDDLSAWITATASIAPYYAGRYAAAADLLAQADTLAARASGLRRRAWIAALHARALAAAGRPGPALSALHQAHALIDAVTDEPTGTDFFDRARLDGITGSCHLLLRDAGPAAELLTAALTRRAGTDAKGRSLLTLDLAACRVIQAEPEEAARLTGTALDIAAGALVRPILDRTRALRADLAGWTGTPAVTELDARLAALAS